MGIPFSCQLVLAYTIMYGCYALTDTCILHNVDLTQHLKLVVPVDKINGLLGKSLLTR